MLFSNLTRSVIPTVPPWWHIFLLQRADKSLSNIPWWERRLYRLQYAQKTNAENVWANRGGDVCSAILGVTFLPKNDHFQAGYGLHALHMPRCTLWYGYLHSLLPPRAKVHAQGAWTSSGAKFRINLDPSIHALLRDRGNKKGHPRDAKEVCLRPGLPALPQELDARSGCQN